MTSTYIGVRVGEGTRLAVEVNVIVGRGVRVEVCEAVTARRGVGVSIGVELWDDVAVTEEGRICTVAVDMEVFVG